MNQYDSLSWLYEVLYAEYDNNQLGHDFLKEHESLLKVNTDLRIHDASCGNGVQAIALEKAGYKITASDISQEMIKLAKKNSAKVNANLEIFQSDWKEIYHKRKRRYNLILCIGNSIVHTLSREDRKTVLKHFYELLEIDGILLLDSRNWEKRATKKEKYEILRQREYNGKNYIPIYMWENVELEKDSLLKMIFIEITGNQQKEYEVPIQFVPFSHVNLCRDCKDVGFTVQKDTFQDDGDWYCLYLKK